MGCRVNSLVLNKSIPIVLLRPTSLMPVRTEAPNCHCLQGTVNIRPFTDTWVPCRMTRGDACDQNSARRGAGVSLATAGNCFSSALAKATSVLWWVTGDDTCDKNCA